MPVKLRRIAGKMYERVPTLGCFGCLGCSFRQGHGLCGLGGTTYGAMCKGNGKSYKYVRASSFRY